MERAATQLLLDAEQDHGTIIRTQSMETLIEPIPRGTGLGSGHRRQDTILGDRPAQTRFERFLNSLMIHLSQELTYLEVFFALENFKICLGFEIKSPKEESQEIVTERKRKETLQLKRRLIQRSEDTETQGRYYQDIDITTASAPITTIGVSVSTVEPSTPPPTTTLIEYEDLIIAQTLMKMRSEKSKEKAKERGSKEKSSKPTSRPTRGVTMQEPSESGTRKAVPPSQHDLKDKGKAKNELNQ
ncbi:hypothetical protein Tco_0611446 [Tanacetum coccineum]